MLTARSALGNLLRMETPNKKRGPKIGSTSFAKIKMSDLTELFGPNACIMISRKFLENCGLTIQESAATIIRSEPEDDSSNAVEEKISYNLTSFNWTPTN